MKTLKIIKTKALLLGLTIGSMACQKDNLLVPTIKGEGELITKNYLESGFYGIDLNMDANVIITPSSDAYAITIEAQENITNAIELKLEQDVLTIGFTKNVRNHLPITIHIAMPILNTIKIRGSGNVITNGKFYSEKFDAKISGSGNINVQIDSKTINSIISGSGKIELAGKTNNAYFKISGSGNLTSLDLYTLLVTAKIAGSGNIRVAVQDTLNAEISGSGNVQYKGTPAIFAKVSGSGSIVNI